MPRKSSRDPLQIMLSIADHFVDRAEELDKHVENAIAQDASQSDICKLMDLAGVNRMRALAAAQAAAVYVHPKSQAVEISPVSQTTASRFEARIANMSEDQVTERLRLIAGGASAIEIIEADDDK
jgi:hypothetical protein